MSMLSIILWTAALALFFAITNAAAYSRGEHRGHANGLEEGVTAQIRKLKDGQYEIVITHEGEEE